MLAEPTHHGFASLKAIQSCHRPPVGIKAAIFIEDVDKRQIVALANLKVVRIVGGRNLDAARAKRRIDIAIGNNRNQAILNRQFNLLTN